MLQTLVKKLKRWKAAAAALPLFLTLPTLGSAQTSDGAPPTVAHPSAQMEPIPAGPIPAGPIPAGPIPAGPACGDGGAHCPGPEEHGLFEAIRGSLFGQYDSSCHTPLGLYNFGEGWLDPWIPAGPGSSGALRGGWVGAPSGFFVREVDPQYSFTQGHHNSPDEHIGDVNIFTPLSRRLELATFVPFVDSLNPGKSGFGDVTIVPTVMLIENKDLGVTSGLSIRTPTGERSTNNGRTDLDPFVALWADLGHAWQLRGGLDVDVPINRSAVPGLPDAVLTVQLALGKTFTLNEGGTSPTSRRTWPRATTSPSTVATSRIAPSTT
jgi:hypothetical protein